MIVVHDHDQLYRGYFQIYAYWVCAARETPISSPKFPVWSIFSQIPEHHHFTFFVVPETIIFEISFRSSRLSLPTSGAPHFHARTTRACSGAPRFSLCRGAPGLVAGQSATQIRPTVRSGDPHFHARARSGAPHFHARAPLACSRAPHFHARARPGAPHFHARARSGAPDFPPFSVAHIPTKNFG